MATRTKARRSKRVIRSYAKDGKDFTSALNEKTLKRSFLPETKLSFSEFGLDSEVRLGRDDLEKLGRPERIKVVIYSLDD